MMLDLIDIHDLPVITEKAFLNALGKEALDSDQVPPAMIDRKSALERTMGDAQFLSELLQAFIEGLPETKKRLEHAVEHGNAGTVAKEAGCLAGAAGNLGVTELSDTAFDLELAGRKGCTAEIHRYFRKLLLEVERLIAHVRSDEFDESRRL